LLVSLVCWFTKSVEINPNGEKMNTKTKTDNEIYCVEYSEYSVQNGMIAFHLGTLKEAIFNNVQDMNHNNRQENKWQIVFIGTLKESSKAFTTLSRNKKRGKK